MKQWAVTFGKSGYGVRVYKVPFWVELWEQTAERLCTYSGGFFGGHPRYDWMWKLQEALHIQAAMSWLEDTPSKVYWRYEKMSPVEVFPITKEQAEQLAPAFVRDMKSWDLDTDDSV